MLPWRRSKFVLVDEGEGKEKGKSFGPALSYAALLSSFVRSCPDLWAECPLERLGGLFRHRRRQKVELNKEDPSYTAWYLGNAVTLQAKGEGCTHEAVEKIWAKSEFGGRSTKMKLTLGPHGIRMGPSEKKGARRPGHAYLLHRITYCAADARHPKVFAWVYRHQVKNKAVVLRCHAVMLSKPEKAQGLAVLLYQTSLSAFTEFKRLKRQSDSRHVQQQLLGEAMVPLAPLRKILNSKCPYRPPADRNRSAPRLSAIQEEEEEEDKGEREEKNRQASVAGSGSSGDANRILAAMIARTGSQSLARTSPGRPVAVPVPCVCQSNRAATDTLLVDAAEDSQPRDKTVAGRLCERASGPERSEVRGLARGMRFCTLRVPTPPVDTPTWDSPKGASCSPC